MLTDETRAALAAMSEGCREALHSLAMGMGRDETRLVSHIPGVGFRVPRDPTAIVAEAARMAGLERWQIDSGPEGAEAWAYTPSPCGDFVEDFGHREMGKAPLTAALRLLQAAWERTQGGDRG